MLTGERAFVGTSQASLISSIMNDQPRKVSDLQGMTPDALDRLVQTCLAKDPEARWQSLHDVRTQLRGMRQAGLENELAPRTRLLRDVSAARRNLRIPVALVWGAVGVLATLSVLWLLRQESSTTPSTSNDFSLFNLPVEVRQQTRSLWAEHSPVLSPDGDFMAFSADPDGRYGPLESDIYVQRSDGGSPIQVTHHQAADWAPAYSPDGGSIAFCSRRGGQLAVHLVGSTGENERKLLAEACWPAWSPDGERLAVNNQDFRIPEAMGPMENPSLRILDLVSGETTKLDTGTLKGVFQPSWASDGRRLVFWGLDSGSSERDLWVIDVETSELTQLTRDLAVDWSPFWAQHDGLVYFVSDRGGTYNLWRIDPSQTPPRPEPWTMPSSDLWFPTFSRDGQRALYSSESSRLNIVRARFSLSTLEIASPQVVASGKGFMLPSVSPDGAEVVFLSTGASPDLFLVGPDGTDLRRLTQDSYIDRYPSFNPDGSWVTFFSNRGGRYQIWAIRPDGTGLEKLGEGFNPIWSPNGRWMRATLQSGEELLYPVLDPGSGSSTPRLGEAVEIPPCEGSRFAGGSFSPDGERMIGSCGSRSESFVYDIATRTYSPTGLTRQGLLVWITAERVLRIGQRTIEIYDLAKRETELLKPFEYSASAIRLAPDLETVVFQVYQHEADLWLADFSPGQ